MRKPSVGNGREDLTKWQALFILERLYKVVDVKNKTLPPLKNEMVKRHGTAYQSLSI